MRIIFRAEANRGIPKAAGAIRSYMFIKNKSGHYRKKCSLAARGFYLSLIGSNEDDVIARLGGNWGIGWVRVSVLEKNLVLISYAGWFWSSHQRWIPGEYDDDQDNNN